ncbi:FkbM family methyltransferase [Falsiruegeria litorea]|uniref:FkbM family methyltransferase n=1 Tax=Falsiruegeria litorea TaxID=1280831 RepID=UPI0013FD37A7|nr:FkbM family methyltransferase [Falsiruegeria litorea]
MNGTANEGPEPSLLQLYGHVLPALDGAFLDVGVNVGQTMLAVRTAAPEMPYLGLEPNPFCTAYVRDLIRINAIDHVNVVPVALMEHPALLQLNQYARDEADSSASLIEGFRPEQTVVGTSFIPAFDWATIATSFAEHRFCFVKIDVEGAELEVLRGLNLLLDKERPWLLTEILPVYHADYSDRLARQRDIETLLGQANYVTFRIKRDENGALSHLQQLDTIGIHDRVEDCDYLIVPSEALDRLSRLSLRIEGPF